MESEADHYRQVAKKYKRARFIVQGSAVGLAFLSVGLSSATLATALSGVGIIASPPLATVAAVSGKKLEKKVTKHEKIYTLPVAKQNSVSDLVSKALTDKTFLTASFLLYFVKYRNTTSLKAPFALLKTSNQTNHNPILKNQEADTPRRETESSKKILSLAAEWNLNLKE